MSTQEPVRSSGARRMRDNGRKLVQVWLTKEEESLIKAAAEEGGKPLATWIRTAAFHAAETAVRNRTRRRRREARDDATAAEAAIASEMGGDLNRKENA